MKLLSNAVKYNRDNGSIDIRAWNAGSMDSISASGIADRESRMVSLNHIFEKFYRSKGTEKNTTGTGLGLSICKKIIESHGGTIEVQSTLNVGSTFVVKLPQQFMGS